MLTSNYAKKAAAAVFMLVLVFSAAGCTKSEDLVLSGTIEATQADASSEVPGKVISILKEEGQPVKKGETIAVLDSSLQQLVVKQQEAAVRIKKARLDELREGSRPEDIKQADAAAEAARASVDSARTAVENSEISFKYANDKYASVKALYDSGSASENDLKDARFKLDSAQKQLDASKKQLDSAEAQLKSAQARLSLLQKGSTDQTLLAAQADLEQAQASLDQAELNLSRYEIKSPIDGTFIVKNLNTGDMVNTGSSAGTVADLSDLWVKVYIPQKYLGLVSLNGEVRLAAPALPGKSIRGKIIFIASEAEFTPKNIETTEAKENTVFRLKIKILDNIGLLKPGMTVDAHIPYGNSK